MELYGMMSEVKNDALQQSFSQADIACSDMQKLPWAHIQKVRAEARKLQPFKITTASEEERKAISPFNMEEGEADQNNKQDNTITALTKKRANIPVSTDIPQIHIAGDE